MKCLPPFTSGPWRGVTLDLPKSGLGKKAAAFVPTRNSDTFSPACCKWPYLIVLMASFLSTSVVPQQFRI